MRALRLIEQTLSGKAAKHVIDALLEELPPPEVIRASMLRDLPHGSTVRFEDERTVRVTCSDRRVLREKLAYFELAYPELEFVAQVQVQQADNPEDSHE